MCALDGAERDPVARLPLGCVEVLSGGLLEGGEMAMKRGFGQLEVEMGAHQGEAGPKRTCGMAYAASPASSAWLDDAAYQTFSKYVKCNGEDRDCDDQVYSEHYLAHRQWWLNYVATMPQAMCAE